MQLCQRSPMSLNAFINTNATPFVLLKFMKMNYMQILESVHEYDETNVDIFFCNLEIPIKIFSKSSEKNDFRLEGTENTIYRVIHFSSKRQQQQQRQRD